MHNSLVQHNHLKKITNKLLTLTVTPLILCLLLAPLALAQKTAPRVPTLTPEPDIQARIELLDQFNNYHLIQPDGSVLILGKVDHFEVKDFNADMFADLRTSKMQGLNTLDQLYLYNPTLKRYVRLTLPNNLKKRLLCNGLQNIQIVKSALAPTISISCSLKRSQNVNHDYLQFDGQGQLWLSQQYASNILTVPQELAPYTDTPWGITQILTVYNPQGQVLATQRTSSALIPIIFKALQAQLLLQASNTDNAATVLTLQKGQICSLVDIKRNWLQLACLSADQQMHSGWLRWDKVTANSAENKPPFIITEITSAKQYR